MSINFFAVMVIYNRNLNDSLSFSSLKNTGVEIFVCDNSTKDMKNSSFESERVHILSMGGNVGLSKAYNKAVESIDGRDGYICFLTTTRLFPKIILPLWKKKLKKRAQIFFCRVFSTETAICLRAKSAAFRYPQFQALRN